MEVTRWCGENDGGRERQEARQGRSDRDGDGEIQKPDQNKTEPRGMGG